MITMHKNGMITAHKHCDSRRNVIHSRKRGMKRHQSKKNVLPLAFEHSCRLWICIEKVFHNSCIFVVAVATVLRESLLTWLRALQDDSIEFSISWLHAVRALRLSAMLSLQAVACMLAI